MPQDLTRLLERAQPQIGDIKEARKAWRKFRLANDATGAPKILTSPEANAKFAHTPVPVYGVSLSPAAESLIYNACRYCTPECKLGCIAFAGHGVMGYVQKGRTLKTLFLGENPDAFITLLGHEVEGLRKKYGRKSWGIRMNAFSDIRWEEVAPDFFEHFSNVQFYDYTKWPYGVRSTPKNYHLTYSVSEKTTDEQILYTLNDGSNVAVVLNVKKGDPMPETWMGFPVIDGDASDARYVDASMGKEKGVVIGLRAKGRMLRGKWKMVREVK